MRKMLIGIVLSAVTICLSAKDKGGKIANDKIKDYLHTYFPNAKFVNTKKMNDSTFHVYLVNKDREVYMDFTNSGDLIITETEITINDLPEAIRKQLQDNDIQFEYAGIIESAEKDLHYVIQYPSQGKELLIYFDKDANIIHFDER